MDQSTYLEIKRLLGFQFQRNRLLHFSLINAVIMGLVIAGLVPGAGLFLRLISIPLIALIMFRSFAMMHEAVHGLSSKNGTVNRFVGVVSGTLCLLSFDSWKNSHLAHHKWSGNVDKDPVMAMIKIFPTWPEPVRRVLSAGWRLWLPTLSVLQHSVFWSLTLKHSTAAPMAPLRRLESLLPVLFWIFVVLVIPATSLQFVVLPGVLLYLLGTEVINAPHHLGLPYVHDDTKIPVWDQFKTARTCVYPTWLARFVVLNFNYHIEHHMYPYAPWYYLDQIHEKVRALIGSSYNLDPTFQWVLLNRTRSLEKVFGCDQVRDHSPILTASPPAL